MELDTTAHEERRREVADAYARGRTDGRDEAFEEARGVTRIAASLDDAERRIVGLAARLHADPGE